MNKICIRDRRLFSIHLADKNLRSAERTQNDQGGGKHKDSDIQDQIGNYLENKASNRCRPEEQSKCSFHGGNTNKYYSLVS